MMFAAGFGTRMGALTQNTPKPLIQVGNATLFDHTLGLVNSYGAETIVANLHYQPEQLQKHLSGTNVKTVIETPDILETGGGLRAALPLLGTGPVFTTNTDAIWQGPNPFELLADRWDPKQMDALLLCVPREQALGHNGKGDFQIAQTGQIQRGPGEIYGGVQILKTDLLASIPERVFSLNLLWDQMLQQGRAHGLSYPGKWCDVGHPEGIALAETLLEASDV